MSSSVFPIDSTSAPIPSSAAGCGARLGRNDAEIVAASDDEVRLRHTGPLKVGTSVPLSYFIGAVRLQSQAVVRSCRVVAPGGGPGGATLYETCVTVCAGSDPSSSFSPTSSAGEERGA